MEGKGTNEQGFDEIEMMFGKIPNASSHAEHIIPSNISSALETISGEENKMISSSCQFINSYNSPQSAKNEENMTYFGSLAFPGISVNQKHQSNGKIDDQDGGYETCALNDECDVLNLPFESSLASAFEDLSFQDNVVPQPINPFLVKYNQTPPNHTSFNNSQSLFGRDTLEMFVPPLNQSMNGVKIDSQGIVDSHGYNGVMPLNPRARVYDLLPNVPVQGIELTTSPYQQQFLDARAPTITLPQHISQSNMEEEMYHRFQQQYLYQQQTHNHMSEVVQFRKNMNSTENQVPSYYGIPSDPSFCWNDNVVHNGYPQFDISAMGTGFHRYHPHGSCGRVRSCEFLHKNQGCNAKNFLEHQILDKIGNPYYPEKILTRSHGVNSLRSQSQNSFTTNRSSSISNNNRRYFSHGHGSHSIVKNNASLQSQSSFDSLESIASRSIQVKYNSVDEVLGRIYYLAKEQHGCRFLQRKFMEGCMEDANKIFGEIIGHIVDLMTDPFGNYLIQKMLEVCTEDQRMQIILAITKEAGMLMRISCNMHGTRAVQKVIETLRTTEQVYIVLSSLKPGIVSLIRDINGNHVAQRCLQYFSPQQSEFIFDAAISHCVEIATDRQGCCVLQKCVYHSHGDQRNRLLSEISSYSLVLSQDPFGNYVVQYVLDQKIPWVITSVLDQLKGRYGSLSMQKHSSNVVEKCLKLSKEEDCVKIIQELMNSPRLLQILQDAYGNFVIQSALKQCKGALNAALLDAIKPHVPALRNHPYGKKILSSASLKK